MARPANITTALCLMLSVVCSARGDSGTDWMGQYRPISAVCRGMNLVIVPHRLSYGDCVSVTYADLAATDGFAGRIDEHAHCALAGKVLTLAPDGQGGNTLSTFDTENAWHEKLPALVCSYAK